MKKIVLLLLSSGIVLTAYCQPKIANFSFENWENKYAKIAPIGWQCDSLSIANGSIKRANGGSDGTYAVQLTTVVDKTNIVSSVIQYDDSLTSIPGPLLFDYKVVNNNSIMNGLYIEIYFKDSKKKALNDFQWSSTGNNTTFAAGSMPISFKTGEIPKYYTLRVSYFYTTALAGEYTIFDNFRFTTTGKLPVGNEYSNIKAFPNPASQTLNFNDQSKDKLEKVRFIGIDGKVSEFTITQSTLDISVLNQGIYAIELINTVNQVIKREKICIMR